MFRFENGTCLINSFSTGKWVKENGELVFTSDYQKGNLPVKLRYRKRDCNDYDTKRISFVKDYQGKPMYYAGVYINSDTLSCYDGDVLCSGDIKSTDSVKVYLDSGPTSRWIKVKATDEIMELTIQPAVDFSNYIIYNEKLRKKKDGLWYPVK
jgi:hypothetical protein